MNHDVFIVICISSLWKRKNIYLPNWRKSLEQPLLDSNFIDCMKIENPKCSELRWSSRWQEKRSLFTELNVNLWAWLCRYSDCLVFDFPHILARSYSLYGTAVKAARPDVTWTVWRDTITVATVVRIILTNCYLYRYLGI